MTRRGTPTIGYVTPRLGHGRRTAPTKVPRHSPYAPNSHDLGHQQRTITSITVTLGKVNVRFRGPPTFGALKPDRGNLEIPNPRQQSGILPIRFSPRSPLGHLVSAAGVWPEHPGHRQAWVSGREQAVFNRDQGSSRSGSHADLAIETLDVVVTSLGRDR